MVIGGPDGYCLILPTTPDARVDHGKVELKGHVGDVLDVQWFPSGVVCVTNLLREIRDFVQVI